MKTVAWIFVLIFFTGAYSQKHLRKYKLVSFSELGKVSDDTVRLKVYVLDIYFCPPCPEGAQ